MALEVTNNQSNFNTGVAEICVPPDFLFPRTHIPSHAPGDICSPDELNAVVCVSQQIGTLALTKSFASSSCIDSIYAPAVLLPWTTREAATMIILHDNTQMPVVQRQLSCRCKAEAHYLSVL